MMSNYESSSSDTRKRKFETKEDNEALIHLIFGLPWMLGLQDFSLMKPSEETSSTSLNDIQSFYSDSAPSSTGKQMMKNVDLRFAKPL